MGQGNKTKGSGRDRDITLPLQSAIEGGEGQHGRSSPLTEISYEKDLCWI